MSLWPIIASVLAALAALLLVRRRAELRPRGPAPRVAVLPPAPPRPAGRIIVVGRPGGGIDENAGPEQPTPDADRLLRRYL